MDEILDMKGIIRFFVDICRNKEFKCELFFEIQNYGYKSIIIIKYKRNAFKKPLLCNIEIIEQGKELWFNLIDYQKNSIIDYEEFKEYMNQIMQELNSIIKNTTINYSL